MVSQPCDSAHLSHGGPLIDTPAIGDHDRRHETGVFASPPAGDKIASSLLLKSTIAQKHNQTFAGQRHMYIVELRKTQVSAFHQPSGGVRVNVTPKRRLRAPVGAYGIGVKVPHELRQALIG